MTPLEAANQYHKERNVQQPNSDFSWYVIAVNDYLKRNKLYTQEELDYQTSKAHQKGYNEGYSEAENDCAQQNAGPDL